MQRKEQRVLMPWGSLYAFALKHILQQRFTRFVAEHQYVLLAAFAHDGNSFEVKFMSSISMPTSSLIRMPVPRNRVRMAKSRACVFLWYAFCLSVNPSPFCTTSSRSATSFGSRRIMALSRIVGRSTRDGALCVSFSFYRNIYTGRGCLKAFLPSRDPDSPFAFIIVNVHGDIA